jgi:hypothetical protein
LVPYACEFQGGTDEVSEAVSPIPAGVSPLSLLALQSDGLGDPQPKYLLGLIDAAQLKLSERLQASVTASRSLSKPR